MALTTAHTRPTGAISVPVGTATPSLWQIAGPLSLVFGALAGIVALIGSWIPSLWGDEAASALSAQRSLPSLFMMLGHVDAVHGTYYLGLHAWVKVFGASPFSLRAPSAIAIGVTAAAVVLICARLGSRRLAILAGIVCAVLPRLTYAGEEARSYAFDAAMATVLTLVFVELLVRSARGARVRWLWGAYALALCLGTYLFMYVALVAVAHAVVLWVLRPPRPVVRRWAMAGGSALLLASPLLILAAVESHQISYLANTPQVTPSSIFVGLWFGNVWFATIGWPLLTVAAVFTVATWWRGRAAGSGRLRSGSGRLRFGSGMPRSGIPSIQLVALAWLTIPSGLLIGSTLVAHVFTARYLTFCAPAAAILIAFAIDRLATLAGRVPTGSTGSAPRRSLLVAAVCTLAVVSIAVPVYIAQRGPNAMNNSDWAQIAAVVHAKAKPGDAVMFDASVRPSRRPRLAMNTYPGGFTGLRDVLLQTPYSRNTTWYDAVLPVEEGVDEGRFHDVQRLWLVEYATPGHADTWALPTLSTLGFHEVAHTSTFRSEIIELVRTPTGTDA